MKVDGLTTCVGAFYADLLSRSLRTWAPALDSLVVVTSPRDEDVMRLCSTYRNVTCVVTDVFTSHGAYFNKGAALNVGYASLCPDGLVVHFDADIIPPNEFRRKVENGYREGCLHGARRVNEKGKVLDEVPIYPYGYFHVWHADDPVVRRWPIFENQHPHAGNYDANFADLWSCSRRVDLGFTVVHHGEPRHNWFGPGSDQSKMETLRSTGLLNVRRAAVRGKGVLALPVPGENFTYPSGPGVGKLIRELAKQLANNPFSVTIGCRP